MVFYGGLLQPVLPVSDELPGSRGFEKVTPFEDNSRNHATAP